MNKEYKRVKGTPVKVIYKWNNKNPIKDLSKQENNMIKILDKNNAPYLILESKYGKFFMILEEPNAELKYNEQLEQWELNYSYVDEKDESYEWRKKTPIIISESKLENFIEIIRRIKK